MYFIYILSNKINSQLYKGVTKDLEKRLKEHNQGKHKYTSEFMPWEIVYYEEYESFSEARERELYFKSGSGREFLKKILFNSI
jgi:putative endonuclease